MLRAFFMGKVSDIRNDIVVNIKCGKYFAAPGIAFSTRRAEIEVFTALHYFGRYYTNVEDEPPMTESELYSRGRRDAILGYGRGKHIIRKDMPVKTYPIKMAWYIKNIRNNALHTGPDSVKPVLFRKTSKYEGEEYTDERGKRIHLVECEDIRFLFDVRTSSRNDTQIIKSYFKKYLSSDMYVGFRGVTPGQLGYVPRYTYQEIIWKHKAPFLPLDSDGLVCFY